MLNNFLISVFKVNREWYLTISNCRGNSKLYSKENECERTHNITSEESSPGFNIDIAISFNIYLSLYMHHIVSYFWLVYLNQLYFICLEKMYRQEERKQGK